MNMNKFKTEYLMGLCLLLGCLTIIIGCAATIQKREVPTSGFLKDYQNWRMRIWLFTNRI